MRYFSIIFSSILLVIAVCVHSTPVYNPTIERSLASIGTDGLFHVLPQKPQNIWYIGINNAHMYHEDICVEWDFGTEKRQECIDHDGLETGQIFTFPVLSQAVSYASFRITNIANINPDDITVFSMDTRPSGSRLTFRVPSTTAENGIISRAEWGADETMRYADTGPLKPSYDNYIRYLAAPKTALELQGLQSNSDIDNFLLRQGGGGTMTTTSLVRYENNHMLYWPIEKVKQVSRIVLHHTAQSLDTTQSDVEMIRGIYAYHTVSRGWGDIGYNYLIGQRGRIYEGRAGGDYVVASHALYNNMGTVGISVLGDYNRNHLNKEQIAGIEQAITQMATKYGITLSDKKQGFVKCDTPTCYPLKTVTNASLMGHQDIGNTSCPGSDIDQYIPGFIARLNHAYTPVLNPILGTIAPLPKDQVMNMTLKVDPVVLPTLTPPVISVSLPVIHYIGPRFRVRLSYPDPKNIILATADGKIGKVMLDTQRIPMQVSQKLTVGIEGNKKITLKVGEKYFTGSELKFAHTIVRVDSWNRVPDWDKSSIYNDNLFRDTIRVLNQGGKLVVINDLPVEWYLKGLGEVSNGDLSEKIKVIVVAARSYARYYMDIKNRKFATHLYDGSDNPDEFQKYLGYGYERRSPNVAKIVDSTRGQVITYSGAIIKAWYHSSSDGQTLSALEYCQKNGSKNCPNIPYLQSVADPGSVGRTRSGHGVGISGVGATYWATSGWDYKKIIQYYLKGVEIQRK